MDQHRAKNFLNVKPFAKGFGFDPPPLLYLGGVLPLLVIAWACASTFGIKRRVRSPRVLVTQCVTALVCRTGLCGHWNSLGTVSACLRVESMRELAKGAAHCLLTIAGAFLLASSGEFLLLGSACCISSTALVSCEQLWYLFAAGALPCHVLSWGCTVLGSI